MAPRSSRPADLADLSSILRFCFSFGTSRRRKMILLCRARRSLTVCCLPLPCIHPHRHITMWLQRFRESSAVRTSSVDYVHTGFFPHYFGFIGVLETNRHGAEPSGNRSRCEAGNFARKLSTALHSEVPHSQDHSEKKFMRCSFLSTLEILSTLN
jgi:hypothetical protein